MSGFLEGAQVGNSMVQSVFDEYRKGRELKERMKERHDAVDAAAAEKHHQLNKEGAEASRQTERDYREQQDRDEEQRRYDAGAGMRGAQKRIAKAEAANLEKGRPKNGSKSAASDPYYKFVKDSLDRASKDVSAWMSAHPGMTPPPDIIAHAKAAKKDHDAYGKAMGYEITDVPDIPEVVPVEHKGLFRQEWDALMGAPGAATNRALPSSDLVDKYGAP
jgi:hypothetical protein